MRKSEAQRALERAAFDLAAELTDATDLIRRTNRRIEQALAEPMSIRDLTQIRKSLNASLKTAPALLMAVAASHKTAEHVTPVSLTADDFAEQEDIQ